MNTTVIESRVDKIVRMYDSQGDHRTGSAVDAASVKWLQQEVRALGLEGRLEAFSLDRVDVQSAYLAIDNRRIGGVPAFDTSFTDQDGIEGTLGPMGSEAEIGVAEATSEEGGPQVRAEPKAILAAARNSRHKAVILVTRGKREGLSLLNAPSFTKPSGPPILQVASVEGAWVMEKLKAGVRATLVAEVLKTPAKAHNLVAQLDGTDASLAPLLITTPRSGWWQCASERGGGLACWLEAMRALRQANPARACVFAAFTGHELGLLGGQAFVAKRKKWIGQVAHWFHFGANIGAPRQQNLIQSSDHAHIDRLEPSLREQNLSIHARAVGENPRGEASLPHKLGLNYTAPVCTSEVFHHSSDRWPEAMDAGALARYAAAFSSHLVALSQAS